MLLLGSRLFLEEGTEEKTVVLLCDGYHTPSGDGSIETGYVATLEDVRTTVDDWREGRWQGDTRQIRSGLSLLPKSTMSLFEEITSSPNAKALGNICAIHIGIVTGANHFFVLDQSTVSEANIPEKCLSPIFAKFNHVNGVHLVAQDLERARSEGRRSLLIDTSSVADIPVSVRAYLDRLPKANREKNSTFKKRKIWHQPNDANIPDAFFPYMQKDGPVIILNGARVNSTNTIHRVYFDPSVNPIERKAIAVSALSTVTQLSAEIEGRSYGSGALKHEPSEAAKLKILLPIRSLDYQIEEAFRLVDDLLRRGDAAGAQDVADAFVLQDLPDKLRIYNQIILRHGLTSLRVRRQRMWKRTTNS